MTGSSLDRAIAALLAGMHSDEPPPDRETVDHVLTSGYAEALDLEAERINTERTLLRLRRSTKDAEREQVTLLEQRLRQIGERLPTLRADLAEIDDRFRAGISASGQGDRAT